MNAFDEVITVFLNQYVGRSWLFDFLVVFVSHENFMKGVVIFSLFWYAWFYPGENPSQARQRLASTLVACFVALALGQILQHTLPFRERPIHTPGLYLTHPHGLHPNVLHDWNSMPSDHATLFFAMSTGLYFVSHSLGSIAFFHAILVVCFPRLYMGLHFATDLMAGAFLGICLSTLLILGKHGAEIGRRILVLEKDTPAIFYSGMFLLTFEMAVLFEDIRDIWNVFREIPRATIKYLAGS